MSTEDVEMDASSSESGSEDSMDEGAEVETGTGEPKSEVYLPGRPLEEGEKLVCDQSAYIMLHQAQTGAPCLSFDVVPDTLGETRDTYPMTAYLVAGTQAARGTHTNNVIVLKMNNLHRTSNERDDGEEDDESDSEDEESEEKKPQLSCASIKHLGCVNRIRVSRYKNSTLAATWSELGHVNVWNITQQLQALDNPAMLERYAKDNMTDTCKPLYTFSGHQLEGFAVDWCKTDPGILATGDCRRDIHIWKPNEAGTWAVDQRPLVGHSLSVEDIQWSPSERCVLASCSVDKTIRIWDTRAAANNACMLTVKDAHNSDVNVISWNKNEPFIASGGDDGLLHIWDLRQFASGQPAVSFKHHVAPVTSVEWHHSEGSVLATAGEDNQLALWDLAVERDDEQADEQDDLQDLPPQLLFIHQGQTDIKELHWHPQLPGVVISTAHTGFNIFKTISVI